MSNMINSFSVQNNRASKPLVQLLLIFSVLNVFIGIFGGISLGLKADWLSYYSAGYGLRSGLASELYNFATFQSWQAPIIGNHITPFLYPAIFAIPFIPLSLLPVQAARIVWAAVNLLAFFFFIKVSRKWTGLSFLESLIVFFSFSPLAYSLAVGQTSLISLLIFAYLVYLDLADRHDFLSGIVAGVALYKPQLLIAIVLYWIAKRYWKPLSGLMASGLIILIGSFIISREALFDYFRLIFGLVDLAATNPNSNASLFAVTTSLGITIAFLVIIALIFSWRQEQSIYGKAMLWLSPLLITPYVGVYDLSLLILPMSLLLPVIFTNKILALGIFLVWISPLIAIPFMNIHYTLLSAFLLFALCFYYLNWSQKRSVSPLPPLR